MMNITPKKFSIIALAVGFVCLALGIFVPYFFEELEYGDTIPTGVIVFVVLWGMSIYVKIKY